MIANGKKRALVATYPYHDEDGGMLYESLRYDPKDFSQRRPDGQGGYAWNLKGVRRVPYCLPELLSGIAQRRTVFVCEGEKDADTLREHHFIATTNAGGTGWPWTQEFAEYFRGAPRVILIADSDKPGRAAALARGALLRSFVDDVRSLDLACERHDGFDVTDWFGDGHTATELRALVDRAPRIDVSRLPETNDTGRRSASSPNGKVHAAPHAHRDEEPTVETNGKAGTYQSERVVEDAAPKARWVLESAADIAAAGVEPIEFDIDGLLTKDDGPALLFGPPGVRKSFVAMHVAKCMVTGDPVFGKFAVSRRARSIFVNFDAGEKTTRRRIAILAPDVNELFVTSPEGYDAAALREVFEQNETAFVVLDCFADMYSSNRGEDQSETMRRFLRELRALYQKHRCNGLVTDHPRRPREGEAAGDYYGSVQKEAAIRTMWRMTQLHSGDPAIGKIKIECQKMNEAEKFPAFAATIAFGPDHIDFGFDGRLDEASGTTIDAPSDSERLERVLRGVAGGMSRASIELRLGWGRDRVLAAIRASREVVAFGKARNLRYAMKAERDDLESTARADNSPDDPPGDPDSVEKNRPPGPSPLGGQGRAVDSTVDSRPKSEDDSSAESTVASDDWPDDPRNAATVLVGRARETLRAVPPCAESAVSAKSPSAANHSTLSGLSAHREADYEDGVQTEAGDGGLDI